TITQRSAQFVHAVPEDPFLNRLSLFEADNPEQEAKALDIQIRRWLLEGKQSIGVITEDRRLARRLRALLERGGVNLMDGGGWALSTTSAAAVIERWLETVEQDFAYVPLLDTLKSPFVCLEKDREHHLQTVHRLETDIITHENIASGLGRYKKHLRKRARRLIDAGIWVEEQQKTTENLLLQLEQAADPFTTLLKGEHDIALYTNALLNSLESLGTGKRLEADAAGQRILQELESLHKTAGEYNIQLGWQEFRGWLGQTLERYTYKTPGQAGPVHLFSLAQGRSRRFSAVIIAGCTAESMPGANHSYAFFNQSVRSELGLQTHSEKLSLKLHDFRHALEAAPEILISYATMKESDPVIPSPWLTAIKTFHSLCYQRTLAHPGLHQLVNEPTAFVRKDMTALPGRQSANPAAALPEQLIPKRWSASMHQNLIDCPYKFFAANGLKLQAREEVRLALAKADYGSLVHRILQAFHGGIDGLPGPWKGNMTESDRSAAEQLLDAISHVVFSTATRDNFHARVWLKTWQHSIPLYIGWQLKHGERWGIDKTEQQLEIPIANNRSCYGRVDRIDKNNDNQHCVLDYKTGALPKKDEVLSGEAVQLPTYALLSENDTTEIAYVQIDKKKVSTAVHISDEAIQPLLLETRERLELLTHRIDQQEDLTAWGDSKVCQYCNIDVICRRESWTESDE
ncbi:MAG: PD-(D/E)XK nuclease family protein, partial [Gammaproteobacteria bacterium]